MVANTSTTMSSPTYMPDGAYLGSNCLLVPQVRNAAGHIVQLTYGDDGMDPMAMEHDKGKPLDFERLLYKASPD